MLFSLGAIALFAATPAVSDSTPHTGQPVAFNAATVKPYVDEVHGLFVAMKNVQTPQQATALAGQLKAELPKMAYQHRQIETALNQLGGALAANKGTPEMKQALDYWTNLGNEGPAMEAEMNRIAKLYPGIAGLFHSFVAIQEEEVPATVAKSPHRRH